MKNIALIQKRWRVDKPSHLAVGILFHFTAEAGIWIIRSNRLQLCWYFLVARGTPATRHWSSLTAYQELTTQWETELSQFSPRSLCNKPQDFTITTRRQWESHKVTRLLFNLWRLLMQALCSWNSRTIQLVTPQYFTAHPLCCKPELCRERNATDQRQNTVISPMYLLSVLGTYCKLGYRVLKNLYQ